MIVRMMQVAAVILALWLVGGASAQQPPSGPPLAAWSVPPRDEPMAAARAWFVASDGARDFVLFEAPPRGEVAAAPEARAAAEGTLRPASGLQLMPDVIAAVDDAVYMVFSKGVSGFPLERRNVLRARSRYLGDRWVTVPAGRFDAEPPLPATGLPVAAAGVRGHLGVLMLGVANAEQLGLMVLEGRDWRTFPVPQDALTLARQTSERRGSAWITQTAWSLVPTPEGALLASVVAGGSEQSRTTVRAWELVYTPATAEDPSRGIWRELDAALPSEFESVAAGDIRFAVIADQLVAAVRSADNTVTVLASSLRSDITVWRPIATVQNVTKDWALAGFDDVGRLLVFWNDAAKSQPRGRPGRMVSEISLAMERPFYEGSAVLANPLSGSDTRIIIIFLVVLLAVVLVFVIRPDAGDGQIALPANAALAVPSQRFIASVIDLILAGAIASQVVGVSALQMLTPAAWVSDDGQIVVLLTLGILIVSGTLFETFLGKTPGKFLLGCEVLQLPRGGDASQLTGPARPTLPRAFVRNAVKWGLPPVAMLALVDPIARHRGDQLARTLVIIRFDVPSGGGDETPAGPSNDR